MFTVGSKLLTLYLVAECAVAILDEDEANRSVRQVTDGPCRRGGVVVVIPHNVCRVHVLGRVGARKPECQPMAKSMEQPQPQDRVRAWQSGRSAVVCMDQTLHNVHP